MIGIATVLIVLYSYNSCINYSCTQFLLKCTEKIFFKKQESNVTFFQLIAGKIDILKLRNNETLE